MNRKGSHTTLYQFDYGNQRFPVSLMPSAAAGSEKNSSTDS